MMKTLPMSLMLLLGACAPVVAPVPAVSDTRSYGPQSINSVPASAPTLSEAYGRDSPHQSGDLRMPKGRGPFPVAMIVHGGCWSAGMGSPRNTAALATWLTQHGVATWNVDYRELGSGGGWPATFNDWAGGLAHLRGLAKRYPLDLGRISVLGHSAGATPALWLASGASDSDVVAGQLPDIQASVLLDGPARLADFVGADAKICGGPVVARLMGGPPDKVPGRYQMVDPLKNLPKAKRVLAVVGKLPPPSAAVVAALQQRGIAVQQIDVPVPSHFDFLAPGTRDFAAIAPALLAATGGK